MPISAESCVGNQDVYCHQWSDGEEGCHVNLAVIRQQHGVYAALNQQLAKEGLPLRGIGKSIFKAHSPA